MAVGPRTAPPPMVGAATSGMDDAEPIDGIGLCGFAYRPRELLAGRAPASPSLAGECRVDRQLARRFAGRQDCPAARNRAAPLWPLSRPVDRRAGATSVRGRARTFRICPGRDRRGGLRHFFDYAGARAALAGRPTPLFPLPPPRARTYTPTA